MALPLTTLVIQLPTDIITQIDARLPPGGEMTREGLASLLVTMGLISLPHNIELTTDNQIADS